MQKTKEVSHKTFGELFTPNFLTNFRFKLLLSNLTLFFIILKFHQLYYNLFCMGSYELPQKKIGPIKLAVFKIIGYQ